MVTVPGAEHQPAGTSWDCRACGEPWPCAVARQRLTQLYDPQTRAIFAAERMIEAARDLPATAPGDLFERFLSWTRTQPDR